MAQLFISYARRDGRALADRLAADLAAKEHEPWLDRSEIEGGEQWSVAIEGAIDGCDALLAVLTQGAFESSVCRGEQSRALRKQKPVIPLLAQADADRPVYLETRHYLDFSAPEGYAASFALLLERVGRAEGVVWAELSPRVRARIDVETPVRSLAAIRPTR